MEEDKQIYTTARSEEVKRQIRTFTKKIREKVNKFRTKSKEKHEESIKADKKKENFLSDSKVKEKKAQNVNVSAQPIPERSESEEDAFYRKYVERKSKTDISERLSIYSIFIYTIFFVIIIIIAFSIYVTLPQKQ